MRIEWHFRKKQTPEFSETPVFVPNLPAAYFESNIEVFLIQTEHEIFKEVQSSLWYSMEMEMEEWKAVHTYMIILSYMI